MSPRETDFQVGGLSTQPALVGQEENGGRSEDPAIPHITSPARAFAKGVLHSGAGRLGVALILIVVLIAAVGPFVRPHDPAEVVGVSFEKPSSTAIFGTDFLGRDAFSRFLSGGWILLLAGLVSTGVAYVVGGALGLWTGYRRGRPVDIVVMAVIDVFIIIPPIVMALALITGAGTGAVVSTVAVAVVLIPVFTRYMRGYTLTVCSNEYVEAAVARGERTAWILAHEILPNLRALVLADFGIRVSVAIALFASLSFLGFGQSPPAPDWGLMISENRQGLTIQPWPVLAPVAAIAALTVGLNLTADAFARAVGRSARD